MSRASAAKPGSRPHLVRPSLRLAEGQNDLRVLTTGSRKFATLSDAIQARSRIFWALDELLSLTAQEPGLKTLTVVHGAAAEGGDDTVHAWCVMRAQPMLKEEPHPARDYPHPLLRNDAMIDLGADLLMASLGPCLKANCRKPRPHGSHGTEYTMRHATLAGIQIWDVSP